MQATTETIAPAAARQRMMARRGAVLVCAYDEDQKFQENRLAGAIPFSEFQREMNSLPRSKEIIFYCACPGDEVARAKAEEAHSCGFEDVKVLAGGANAWRAGNGSM